MKVALEQIHGRYEESFQLLFNWKAQMEISQLGSIIEIEVEKIGKKCVSREYLLPLSPL